MSQQPSYKGHALLRIGDGWTCPDYMLPGQRPLGVVQVRRLIDEAEAQGREAMRHDFVTWDTNLTATSRNLVVYCTNVAPLIGCARGDPVRVTVRRIEPREDHVQGDQGEERRPRSYIRDRVRGRGRRGDLRGVPGPHLLGPLEVAHLRPEGRPYHMG